MTIAVATAALIPATIPPPSEAAFAQRSSASEKCPILFTQKKHRSYSRTVLLGRTRLTERAQERLLRMRVCQHSPAAKRNARTLTRRLRNRRARWLVYLSVKSHLDSIAACESHGNPRAVSASGTFRGKYQFSYSTWASVGGRGDPAKASEAEQDYRAARLLKTGGAGHWPVCG